MSGDWLRPPHLAAATLLLGGALLLVLPQYAGTIVRLMLVSMAAAAALYALTYSTPPRWWRSPFVRHARRPGAAHAADEVAWVRSLMAGARQRLPGAAPLPPEILSALQPLVLAAVTRHGETGRSLLSGQSRAVLDAAAHRPPPWYRMLPPDAVATARAVQAVLDDVENLTTATSPEPT